MLQRDPEVTVTTPREAGFRMPPEWAAHTGCWMAWPCRPENWDDIEKARAKYAEIARAIAGFEPVTMTANAADLRQARRALAAAPDVDVVELAGDDSWARDTAPTFVVDDHGTLGGVDWRFNAYGGIYEEYGRTATMARRILDLLGARRFAAPIVFEGGAVHTDGEGTLLTTTEVVLNENRNPGLSREGAERILCDHLGAERVVWLTGALDHDNTGGHVDNLACFARPGVVLASSETDPHDSQYVPLQENLRRLRTARDARGRALEVIEILQPRERTRGDVTYSPSYVNFYLADGAVIVPVFGDPRDGPALATLARVYPRREIVPIEAWVLARSDGAIHCITQQQPAAAKALSS
jgi:agmatine deiminase